MLQNNQKEKKKSEMLKTAQSVLRLPMFCA